MISIKKPNISTNRYKELLQIEKYYNEYRNKYNKEVEENIKLKEKNYILQDKLYIFEENIENIIFQLEHNPRKNAETRDKYIIDELKKLLDDDDV